MEGGMGSSPNSLSTPPLPSFLGCRLAPFDDAAASSACIQVCWPRSSIFARREGWTPKSSLRISSMAIGGMLKLLDLQSYTAEDEG